MTNHVLIIAEVGVNHNGDMVLAKKLIDAAKDAGADLVKFQTFKTESLVTSSAPKASYQNQIIGQSASQMEMLQKLELSFEMHKDLADYCKHKGIEFFSTGFDRESLDLLAGLGIKQFKIPSGEITTLPYLRHVGSFKKPIILSTGMASLGEIEAALGVLEDSGIGRENITVLHCNTEYPTPMQDVNLLAMSSIGQAFGVKVGYSDHTVGIEVPIAAVALGATVIEKHMTLDKTLPGPDHRASLNPSEFKSMVSAIRHIEQAMGSGIKRPSPSESKNKETVRKSIVAIADIKRGDVLSTNNIGVKRPGNGISPMRWDEAIGKIADRDYKSEDLIKI